MKYSVLILILILFSCKQKAQIIIRKSEDLNSENLRFTKIYFESNSKGFIGGSQDIISEAPAMDSNTFAVLERHSKIYNTFDGGINWTESNLGSGVIKDIISNSNNTYAVNYNKENNESTIFTFTNLLQWKPVLKFPNIISSLFIANEKLCFVGKDSLNDFTAFITDSSFKSYRSLHLEGPIYNIIGNNNLIFYLSSKSPNSLDKDVLIVYDVVKMSVKKINLPENFECLFFTSHDNSLRLFGTQKTNIIVYSLDSTGNILSNNIYISNEKIFPKGAFNTREKQYIIIGKYDKSGSSSFMIRSKNNSNTWDIINFKKDTYIDPFCFFLENNKVIGIFYSGSGNFQFFQDQ